MCDVIEYKMKIEPTKELLGKEYHTRNDVELGIERYLYCLEKNIAPNLTNYYRAMGNIVWI